MATVVAILGAVLVGLTVLYVSARVPAIRRAEERIGWLGRSPFRIVIAALLLLIVAGVVGMALTS